MPTKAQRGLSADHKANISETNIHKSILKVCALVLKDNVRVFHVPNNRMSARDGAYWKAMGVLAGVPDLVFVLANGVTLWMEVKAPGGRLTDGQKAFHEALRGNGHLVVVVYSTQEALAVLNIHGALKCNLKDAA